MPFTPLGGNYQTPPKQTINTYSGVQLPRCRPIPDYWGAGTNAVAVQKRRYGGNASSVRVLIANTFWVQLEK